MGYDAGMKPYSHTKIQSRPPRLVANSASRSSENKFLVLLTALSVLVTPIVVAIISYNSNRTSTDKDYVNIAVSILNAKDSSKENRQWALRILNKLSPIPFSEKGQETLAGGGELYAGEAAVRTQIVKVPVAGPPMVLVHPGEKLVSPCDDPRLPARGSISNGDLIQYLTKVVVALRACQLKQQYALQVVDLLQGTGENPQTRVAKDSPVKLKPTPKPSATTLPDPS